MASDSGIKRNVEDDLRWTPDVDPSDIGVAVKNGVVALSGFVKSYTEKMEAEGAAKRITGVVGVANDLEVRLPDIDERPDPDIARDAVAAIKNQYPFSSEHIKVTVEDGWVTLEGEVEWNYARRGARKAVRRIKGVKGVTNLIEVKPQVAPEPNEIESRIARAFERAAHIDANRVQVETHGGEVILKGRVRSWVELEEAEAAAWRAPGVTKVDDRLVISP